MNAWPAQRGDVEPPADVERFPRLMAMPASSSSRQIAQMAPKNDLPR
jgi:hypothetical protein